MKIRPVRAELFHPGGWMDEQTDKHDKFIIAWSNFANVQKRA